jgi:hypothetical protein
MANRGSVDAERVGIVPYPLDTMPRVLAGAQEQRNSGGRGKTKCYPTS